MCNFIVATTASKVASKFICADHVSRASLDASSPVHIGAFDITGSRSRVTRLGSLFSFSVYLFSVLRYI